MGLPLARRFPIRIELRIFSHYLLKNPHTSLLRYLCQEIGWLGNSKIEPDDLILWLKFYPAVLILDGLDEVPPSSNRADVICQIDRLCVDVATINADLLIIATTRPQSYTKEFSEKYYKHLYLTALSSDEALEYGKKLAEARYGADERRHSPIWLRLCFTRMTKEDIYAMAQMAASMPNVTDVIWRPVKGGGSFAAEQCAHFFVNLGEMISGDTEIKLQALSYSRECLSTFLAKRASSLQNAGVWAKLRLPPHV